MFGMALPPADSSSDEWDGAFVAPCSPAHDSSGDSDAAWSAAIASPPRGHQAEDGDSEPDEWGDVLVHDIDPEGPTEDAGVKAVVSSPPRVAARRGRPTRGQQLLSAAMASSATASQDPLPVPASRAVVVPARMSFCLCFLDLMLFDRQGGGRNSSGAQLQRHEAKAT